MVAALTRQQRESERQCIVTRQRLTPEQLIRFVAGPDGTVVADLAGKLPGRGCWVSCHRATLDQAIAKRGFARALKTDVKAPSDLSDQVAHGLRSRALSALSLARKAGTVITGFAKLEAAIGSGDVLAILHAGDAGADGIEKLDRRLRAVNLAKPSGAPIHPAKPTSIELFTRDELSLALGGPNVVHAGLMTGGASQKFLSECDRLRRYLSAAAPQEEPEAREIAPDTDRQGSEHSPGRGPDQGLNRT